MFLNIFFKVKSVFKDIKKYSFINIINVLGSFWSNYTSIHSYIHIRPYLYIHPSSKSIHVNPSIQRRIDYAKLFNKIFLHLDFMFAKNSEIKYV